MYFFKDSCSFRNRGLLLHELAESRWKKKSYLTIYAPMIYTAPCIMFLDACISITRGSGRGWALEFSSFLGPVKWHLADRRVPYHRAQMALAYRLDAISQGPKNLRIPGPNPLGGIRYCVRYDKKNCIKSHFPNPLVSSFWSIHIAFETLLLKCIFLQGWPACHGGWREVNWSASNSWAKWIHALLLYKKVNIPPSLFYRF